MEGFKQFLSSILNIEILNIDVAKEVVLKKGNVNEKIGVVDLYSIINENQIADIEIQRKNYNNTRKRSIYYASKLITNQLKSGQYYNDILDVSIIFILDYNIFKNKDYLNKYMILDTRDKNIEHLGTQEYYFIELPKFRKSKKDLNDVLSQWFVFIDSKNKEEVKEVMARNTLIKESQDIFDVLTGTTMEQRIHELKMKREFDETSARNYYINKWKMNIAKKMIKNKLDINMIAEITSLDIKDIKKMKEKMRKNNK